LAPRNPVSAATRPAVPRTTITPPEADDVRFLLALAERHDAVLACWLHVAVATGARRGEVCALRWSDVGLGHQVGGSGNQADQDRVCPAGVDDRTRRRGARWPPHAHREGRRFYRKGRRPR